MEELADSLISDKDTLTISGMELYRRFRVLDEEIEQAKNLAQAQNLAYRQSVKQGLVRLARDVCQEYDKMEELERELHKVQYAVYKTLEEKKGIGDLENVFPLERLLGQVNRIARYVEDYLYEIYDDLAGGIHRCFAEYPENICQNLSRKDLKTRLRMIAGVNNVLKSH